MIEKLELGKLSDEFKGGVRVKPTFLQVAGVWLFLAVLILGTLLIVGLLVYMVLATPPIAAFGVPITADSLALHQKVSDQVFQRVTGLLDQLFLKALLPMLTLLLGYIFGSREGQLAQGDGGR